MSEKKEEFKLKEFINNYIKIIKKITIPTISKWWNTLWKVSLIIVVFGTVLFVVDYLILEGVLGFQSFMSPLGVKWLEVFYSVSIFITGFIAAVGVLTQQGDDSGGLTAMLGSSVQYGDTTGSFSKRISKITFISSGVLLLLVIFSPIFLGAN